MQKTSEKSVKDKGPERQVQDFFLKWCREWVEFIVTCHDLPYLRSELSVNTPIWIRLELSCSCSSYCDKNTWIHSVGLDFSRISIWSASFCVCPNSFEVRHLMQARRRPKPSVIEEEKEPWVPRVKWCQWDAGTSSFYLFCLQHTGHMNHEEPWHNLRSIAPYTLQAINKTISVCLVEKDSSKRRYLVQLANCKELRCLMFDDVWCMTSLNCRLKIISPIAEAQQQ